MAEAFIIAALFSVASAIIIIILEVWCGYRCNHNYKKIEYMGRGGITRYILVCTKCGKTKYLRG